MQESWFDKWGLFLCVLDGKIERFWWTNIHQDFVKQDLIGEPCLIIVGPSESRKGNDKAVCTERLIYLEKKGYQPISFVIR
jgi:hypothetical protein